MSPEPFLRAVSVARSAPVHRQPAMRMAALALGGALAEERDVLTAKLERQWVWLENVCADHRQCQEEHDALFHEREEKFLATLATYESVCDALDRGRKELLTCR